MTPSKRPVTSILSRQMDLFKRLGEACEHRDDRALPISDIDPRLVVTGPTSFGAKDLGIEDLSYDMTALLGKGWISVTHVVNPSALAIILTRQGLSALAESEKSWLEKAIDKQPINAVQVVVTIVLSLLSAGGGYWLGRQNDSTGAPSPGASPPELVVHDAADLFANEESSRGHWVSVRGKVLPTEWESDNPHLCLDAGMGVVLCELSDEPRSLEPGDVVTVRGWRTQSGAQGNAGDTPDQPSFIALSFAHVEDVPPGRKGFPTSKAL